MRRLLIITLVTAIALSLAACGGSKKLPPVEDEFVNDGYRSSGETTSSAITEEEDLTSGDETTNNFSEEDLIGETPISDMTLEEINAKEFLKNVYFDFDKFELTDSAISQLEQNALWLKENASVRVIIEGHCDERGTEEYNLALGERRANTAKAFLISMGIADRRMMTASYGESRPAQRGSSEAAFAMNRRAHFRIFAK